MRRTLPWLALVGTALAGGACITVERDEPVEGQDRVVGIELKCDLVYGSGDEVRLAVFTGETCKDWMTPSPNVGYTKINLRREVTVRTSSGFAYVVTYEAANTLKIGDPWPP